MTEAKELIVIVDDDADIRDVVADSLLDDGFHVLGFSRGTEALAHLRRNPGTRLVLLDWIMPEMDGAQFLEELRKDPTLDAVAVVLLTADRRAGEKAAACGARACLEKPVSLDDLLEMARAYAA
jgi:two-component system, chemotaxis family, chemotaxis protein CheY